MLGTPLGRILLDRPAWTYLLGPFFKASTPDQAAPLSATYREAGAVGALTVVDTESKLSIAAGALVVASGKAAPAYGDPSMIAATAVARVTGRAVVATVAISGANDARFGFALTAASECNAFRFNATNQVRLAEGGVGLNLLIGTLTTALANQYAVVLRSAGAWHLVRAPADALWTLLYVATVQPSPSVYAVMSNTNATISATNFRVADLPGAWASDYGIATDRKATSAATDTITHTANCLVEHTITAATGVTQELWVRRTDASNGWIVRMSQAGSTIKLIEVVAGVETERASTAQTWTNGTAYRVVVICDGTTITPYVANVAKTGYASASTNQSATTAYVDTAGADLVSWPRTVSLPTGV